MTTSALINRQLRSRVVPILKDGGFQKVDARNAWSWRGDFVWVFNVRAVGDRFSSITGWPPGSVGVSLGVFFVFASPPKRLRVDAFGRPQPPEHHCQMRSHLTCGLNQSERTAALAKQEERDRDDIWWLDPAGENAELVAEDIARSLTAEGLPWYSRNSDPQQLLELVEAERDCFVKFAKAALLARHFGDVQRWHKYDVLAEAEALRIGHSLDRSMWNGI